MKILSFILELSKKFPGLLFLNILLMFLVSIVNIFYLVALGPLIDFYTKPDLEGISNITQKFVSILHFFNLPVSFEFWSFIFIASVIIGTLFMMVARYFLIKTRAIILKDLMMESLKDFFNAKWSFFSSKEQGLFLNTITQEINYVGNAFEYMGLVYMYILQALLPFIVALKISFKITLISSAVILIFSIPFILLDKLSKRYSKKRVQSGNMRMSLIQQYISMAKLVLGFGNKEQAVQSIDKVNTRFLSDSVKSQFVMILTTLLFPALVAIMIVVALFAAKWTNTQISEIVVLLLALRQSANSFGQFVSRKNGLYGFLPSYEQVKRLCVNAQAMKQFSGDIIFDDFKKEINIEGLYFWYVDGLPVLKDINMVIPKSNMIAFVGKSGAGKSTLIDMIMGFHEQTSGEIKIDGISLKEYDITSFRKKIGYVPQESVLFNLSIKDNLLWSKSDASQEEIDEACRLSHADEFITNLPDGYETIVGDRGVRLSGGQLQRIALARALLRKPEILILDEATSSLDSHSEQLIQDAIDKVSKATTIIIIAHRLSTVKKADCIYVMNEGRIIEKGSYQGLVSKKGYFDSMVKLQELK